MASIALLEFVALALPWLNAIRVASGTATLLYFILMHFFNVHGHHRITGHYTFLYFPIFLLAYGDMTPALQTMPISIPWPEVSYAIATTLQLDGLCFHPITTYEAYLHGYSCHNGHP